jgi:endonuclease-3
MTVAGITPGRARRESRKARQARGLEILARLAREYPQVRLALDFQTPLQLLVATVLAAQSTDEKINQVTPPLFARYPRTEDLAQADLGDLEVMVHATGFFRNKARAVKGLAMALVAEHGGEVPASLEALVALPGVGRKTANVVLGNAFGQNAGIAVDTHVQRLAGRLFLSEEIDAEKIERDLTALLPREEWTRFALLLQDHGRKVCKARRPECAVCVVADLCPSAEP